MNKATFALKNIHKVWRLLAFSNLPWIYPLLKPKPFVASCKITENCNSKCVGCNFHKTIKKDMPFTEWVSIFEQLTENDIFLVRLTGGEPMMRPDVTELVHAATGMGISVTMQSNILLLNEEKIRKLAECGLKKISISIDGIGREYTNSRGVDSFHTIRDLLPVIRYHFRENASITPIINHITLQGMRRVVEFANEVQIPISAFNLVGFTHYFLMLEFNRRSYEELDREELRKFWNYLSESRSPSVRANTYDLYAMNRYFLNYRIPDLPCLNPIYKMCIGSRGDIYGCCSMPAVGNIIKHSLQEILTSQKMAEIVKAALYKLCPGCPCGLNLSAIMNIKYRLRSIVKKKDKW